MKVTRTLIALSIAAGCFVFLGYAYMHSTETTNAASGGTAPNQRSVVVELFTSEGCSSCPPADALLKKLSEQPSIPGAEVIALEEHVDYWDHLGWKDPFSSAEFTERQNEYSRVFGNSGVYTPQMVVDGQTEFVGSRSREARDVIQKAAVQPKVSLQLMPSPVQSDDNSACEITISNLSALPLGHTAELWVAITEKGLHTNVKAGENSGENLQHAAVVRTIRKASSFSGANDLQFHTSLKLHSSWQRDHLSFVAFAVDKSTHKIIGASSMPLQATTVDVSHTNK